MPNFVAVGECMVEMAPIPGGTDGSGGGRYRLGYAGDTFNTAWYARALLPADARVEYVTTLGMDEISDRMASFMASNGIETSRVARIADRTVGLYLISLDNGERSFSYWRSHSAARLLARHLPDPLAVLGDGDVLHLSSITLAIHSADDREQLLSWVKRARATCGITVSFDPNIRPRLWESAAATAEWIARSAAMADIVFPSLDEETGQFGSDSAHAVIERYLQHGAGCVVVKNGGEEGMVGLDSGELIPFTPQHVSTVIDTTAAGDAFNAGYLAGLMDGLTPLECALRGTATAAIVVAHPGALVDHAEFAGMSMTAQAASPPTS